MKYIYSPVGIEVECRDCDWKTESYKNGQALAARHAKKYGHEVKGSLHVYFVYNPRPETEALGAKTAPSNAGENTHE